MSENWNELASIYYDTSRENEYLRVNEFTDVYYNLLHLRTILATVESQPASWKWAIIVAHNTVQGACTCILSGTTGVGALTKDSAKNVLDHLETQNNDQRPWPKERLAPLSQLLRRLPEELRMNINELKSPYRRDQQGDMKRLMEMRDEFTHFTPMHWSIEIAGLPRIIGNCIDLVKSIVDSPNYQRVNKFRDLDIQGAIDAVESSLSELDNQ